MIDVTTIIPTVMTRLGQLPPDHYLDMRTCKRNRSVLIIKTGEDEYRVIEDGFFNDEFASTTEKLPKLLKTLLNKEFPRSTKVRLYTGEHTGGGRPAPLPLKKI